VGYNASAVCKNLQRFVLRLENNFFILLFKNAVAYYNAGVVVVNYEVGILALTFCYKHVATVAQRKNGQKIKENQKDPGFAP
jgi:hypothetical protein